jgi:hypothetical protein
MLKLRSQLAANAKYQNFFEMQTKQQTFRIAKNPTDLLLKI